MPKAAAKKTKSALKAALIAVAIISTLLLLGVNLNNRQTVTDNSPTTSNCEGLFINTQCYKLERVQTAEKRTKGLSDRDKMPPDTAMLFVFDMPAKQCIWMKDMRFSLDIVWLNEHKEIIKIEPNVSPNTFPTTFCSDNTKYVIEFNQGLVQSSGLKLGHKLKL